MSAHFLRRSRRYSLNETGLPELHPQAVAWALRVVANGGATPSANTTVALSVFYQGLVSNTTLLAKMKIINCFAPDSLIAAATALYYLYGNQFWTIHGFVAGDLTVNGLKGDGSSKYLEPGINPSTCFASTATGGQTIYCPSDTGNFGTGNMSCYTSGSQCYALYLSGGDNNSYCDMYDQTPGQGRISASNPSFMGYLSGNVGSLGGTTTRAIYKASSTFSHAAIATGTSAGSGALPNYNVIAFGQNSNGSMGQFDPRRWSFCAIHDGLTLSESLAFYNLIQTMRQQLGGGYA